MDRFTILMDKISAPLKTYAVLKGDDGPRARRILAHCFGVAYKSILQILLGVFTICPIVVSCATSMPLCLLPCQHARNRARTARLRWFMISFAGLINIYAARVYERVFRFAFGFPEFRLPCI